MKFYVPHFIAAFTIIAMSCNTQSSNKNADADSMHAAAGEAASDSLFTTEVTYSDGSKNYKSFAAYKNGVSNMPVVLVVPEWWGVNDYTKTRVKQLAELGYYAMAVDMYGDGKVTESPDSAGAWATPFYKDAQLAKNNFNAALIKSKTFTNVDTSKIAAIGYCFGGGMVLNMARLGENLDGVASFHGSLNGNLPPAPKGSIKAAILVCHGNADSMVPEKDVSNFKKEMDNAGADYSFIGYDNAKHAFTNPQSTAVGEKYNLDIAYNAAADQASWKELQFFLQRIFQ
ncbi:dienelactone hydrolase family protein [Niabella insulamsoli]|uniref:dienelactone hydrolase family protein n=1 Tax=Niabella insulamsoli TaxID=3144874 RepID=UPI0031FC5D97